MPQTEEALEEAHQADEAIEEELQVEEDWEEEINRWTVTCEELIDSVIVEGYFDATSCFTYA